MSAIKSLIDAGIAAQSVALLGENYKVAKDSFATKKIKASSKADTKRLLKLGIKNIVGINLLRAQAQSAEGL